MTTVDRLQDLLAAEHASFWIFGILGARVSGSTDPALRASLETGYAAHRARRDELVARLRELGEEPVEAAAAYRIPTGSAPKRVRAEAARVEEACAGAYLMLVAESTGADRAWAIQAATEAAIRRVVFTPEVQPFPGLPEFE